MAMLSGRQTVLTAGQPVALADHSTPVQRVDIRGMTANTDEVWVGDAHVRAHSSQATGLPVLAKETIVLESVDLAQVFIDSVVAGEGVTWLAT